MEMPAVYVEDILNVKNHLTPDGTQTRVYSLSDPPVGFFPFAGTDQGDCYGLYWPIGREEGPPVVAYTNHDVFALIPVHGDLAAAVRYQLACGEDHDLTSEWELALDAANVKRPTIAITEVIPVDAHKQLLTLDPDSPFRNCAVADQLIVENKPDEAETHYRRAIELLPEYGAAHFGLGYLLRRTQRHAEASIHLRRALFCPLAFSGGSFWADHRLPGPFRPDWNRKALLWLQQLKEPDESLRDDPFMQHIQELTLKTGVAESRDLELALEMVEEYSERGDFLEAAFLWITVGNRADRETTSFRERYGMTPRSYGNRLANMFRHAGLERRAELVESLLSMMTKPDRY